MFKLIRKVLFVVFFITIKSEKIVKVPYYLYDNQYYLRMFIGEPKRKAFHTVNFNLNYTWTFSFFYNYTKSSTSQVIKEDILNIGTGKIKAKFVKDSVSINLYDNSLKNNDEDRLLENNININSFSFYSTDLEFLNRASNHGLGFSYKIKKEYSLVHSLKNQGLIDHNIFGFSSLPSENKLNIGILYFGGIPKVEKDRFNYKGFCNVNRNKFTWSCKLKNIYFKKENSNQLKLQKETKIYFWGHLGKIMFEHSFYDYFLDTVFGEDLKNKRCKKDYFGQLICEKTSINKGNIYFLFESFEIELKISDLFDIQEVNCYSHFYSGNSFIFGTSFLTKFTTEFDYDQRKIGFYSNDYVIQFTGNSQCKNSNLKILVCCLIFFCIVGIFLSLPLYFKQKNSKNIFVDM